MPLSCAAPAALQDAALTWFAANFVHQKHPLVVAMQQQVGWGARVARQPVPAV